MTLLYDVQALRDHWKNSPASSIQLQELGPLLRDYQRLILRRYSYDSIHPFPHYICYYILTIHFSINLEAM